MFLLHYNDNRATYELHPRGSVAKTLIAGFWPFGMPSKSPAIPATSMSTVFFTGPAKLKLGNK